MADARRHQPEEPAGHSPAVRIAVACIVATVAFWAYTQTLLPGVDLGDTGGFQAAVLWPDVSARQAYPLYYGLARPFVAATSPANPARGLNLFSALWAAAAVGLLTFASASVTRSLAGGAAAGLFLAFSYTFWSQAVIAEVYSLHLALIGLCFVSLYAYAASPTTGRLAIFFVVYALSFGHHLSMILLLAPFALFLVRAAPRPRALVTPAILALAIAAALAGMLQYWPNVRAMWTSVDAPEQWVDRAAAFWFDTTKADWRQSMVLGVPATQAWDRLAMWWFDARQQFGIAGLALALAGAAALGRRSRPWAFLIGLTYAIATAFALTYNVGDTHVFLLPSHFVTAFCAGAAVAWLAHRVPFRRRIPFGRGVELPSSTAVRGADLHGPPGRAGTARPMVAALAVISIFLYAGWRGWTTWPAVDRHDDRRGEELITRLTLGVSERDAIFVSQMNWQLENVLLYVARHQRPDLAWVRLSDVLLHWPWFVEDNRQIRRDMVLGTDAAAEVVAAYGPAFPMFREDGLAQPALPAVAAQVPRGVPYVVAVLTPPREERLDPDALARALATLTGNRLPARTPGAYEVIAGITGERPQLYRSSNRPFTEQVRLLDAPFTIRMDSWLPSDTFRRSGFGHVLRGREHILIIERGVNLVWLGLDGRASPPYYEASLFAAKPRYRIPSATLELAMGPS